MNEYPYILSYTLPNGYEVKVTVSNDGQAEAAMGTMFERCGPAVKYSID